ncbi:hypothetical protein F6J84_08315 [Microbacterium caowuchunii]|uniref:hypothetical protein n=1 Tax=Microbacterium caowuchunii TaxID=2614638 RepID=UPI001244374C|nr:hypothetical protein [Microbacterium caowuchunii]QEW00102.1 hypothetical protein F6J84_08315 [Microbacterium caowuchunii]
MDENTAPRSVSAARAKDIALALALVAATLFVGTFVGALSGSVTIGVLTGVVIAGLTILWAWRLRRSGEPRTEELPDRQRRLLAEERRTDNPYGPAGRPGASGFGTPGI